MARITTRRRMIYPFSARRAHLSCPAVQPRVRYLTAASLALAFGAVDDAIGYAGQTMVRTLPSRTVRNISSDYAIFDARYVSEVEGLVSRFRPLAWIIPVYI